MGDLVHLSVEGGGEFHQALVEADPALGGSAGGGMVQAVPCQGDFLFGKHSCHVHLILLPL